MEKELKLVYVHEFGESWDGDYIYEFLFSKKIDDIDGDYWDAMPASGKPTPPPKQYIELVGTLKSSFIFDVLQKSTNYRMWDGVDGVIPLGVENIEDYEEYPEKRMCFHYGITKDAVEKILYRNDLILKYKKKDE